MSTTRRKGITTRWVFTLRVDICMIRPQRPSIHVYRATVVTRLMYAASAWRGLAKASDLRRINTVIDRARRHRYCPPNLPTFDELCDTADDELFSKVVRINNHVLHTLLPPPTIASQKYNLRHRTHQLQLPTHTTHLMDCSFITRML